MSAQAQPTEENVPPRTPEEQLEALRAALPKPPRHGATFEYGAECCDFVRFAREVLGNE